MTGLFRDPLWLLWGALAFAALAGVGAWAAARRRRLLALFAEEPLLGALLPADAGRERRAAFLLRLGAVALLCLALAGPRWGIELVTGEQSGVHAVIAVDVSHSMSAQDLKPDRLTRAKVALATLLDELRGHRVGIVAFSGAAAVQCPLTTDLAAARLFLEAMRPGMIRERGTAVGEAVRLAARMLEPYPGRKGLVLLTDGEDTAGSDPEGAAKRAAEAGVEIYAVGIGSPDGEPIPERDPSGKVAGYRRDETGKVVLSRLDEAGLAALAKATGGVYVRPSASGAEIVEIASRLKQLERSRLAQGARERYKDRTRLPLALALLLLLAEAALPLLRRRAGSAPRAPARTAAAAGLLLGLLAAPAAAADATPHLREGNRLLDAGKHAEAVEAFRRAAEADPADARAPYNEGVARFEAGDFEAAAEAFGRAAELPGDLKRDALYNRGNALFRADKTKDSVQAYRGAIVTDLDDDQARENLQVALTRKQLQQREQPKDDKKQDKKQDKDQSRKQDSGSEKKDKGMSQEDAKRILEALKEKERSNFQGEQYDRAGKLAKPGKGGGGGKDW